MYPQSGLTEQQGWKELRENVPGPGPGCQDEGGLVSARGRKSVVEVLLRELD